MLNWLLPPIINSDFSVLIMLLCDLWLRDDLSMSSTNIFYFSNFFCFFKNYSSFLKSISRCLDESGAICPKVPPNAESVLDLLDLDDLYERDFIDARDLRFVPYGAKTL